MSLSSNEDLRTVYRRASGAAVAKVIDLIDDHCRDFLATSPLLILSTAGADGVCDGSPKGGQPGFVKALDDRTVAWADSAGNNRLDSFENIVDNPNVAALFLIPGLDETLRINGTAELSTDPDLCERFELGGRPAKVVLVLTVVEAYLHCAKALRRSSVWDPRTWPDAEDLPDALGAIRDHAGISEPLDQIRASYDADVQATLWSPCGTRADSG